MKVCGEKCLIWGVEKIIKICTEKKLLRIAGGFKIFPTIPCVLSIWFVLHCNEPI